MSKIYLNNIRWNIRSANTRLYSVLTNQLLSYSDENTICFDDFIFHYPEIYRQIKYLILSLNETNGDSPILYPVILLKNVDFNIFKQI